MKKTLIALLAIITIFTLTACGKTEDKEEPTKDKDKTSQKENKEETKDKEKEKEKESTKEKVIVDDDIIIDFDDEDTYQYEDEKIVVEEIVNCPGCVFGYFDREGNDALKIGDTLKSNEYTTDISTLKKGSKQRHNFFGFVLDSNNKITKAYSCIWKDKKIYCIEGSTNGAYYQQNISYLNTIFNAKNCKFLSNNHTYWCTAGGYTGDAHSDGYTSLHYETSCTIYGADSNTGKLICH